MSDAVMTLDAVPERNRCSALPYLLLSTHGGDDGRRCFLQQRRFALPPELPRFSANISRGEVSEKHRRLMLPGTRML